MFQTVTAMPATPLEGKAVVRFFNNDEGYDKLFEIDAGTTVHGFLDAVVPGFKPANFNKRVNRQTCAPTDVLQHGDRISLSPAKVDGSSYAL
jgi:hypothetical protein